MCIVTNMHIHMKSDNKAIYSGILLDRMRWEELAQGMELSQEVG